MGRVIWDTLQLQDERGEGREGGGREREWGGRREREDRKKVRERRDGERYCEKSYRKGRIKEGRGRKGNEGEGRGVR